MPTTFRAFYFAVNLNLTKTLLCILLATTNMALTNNSTKSHQTKNASINNCATLHEIAYFRTINNYSGYNRALLRLFAADCCFFLCVRERPFLFCFIMFLQELRMAFSFSILAAARISFCSKAVTLFFISSQRLPSKIASSIPKEVMKAIMAKKTKNSPNF